MKQRKDIEWRLYLLFGVVLLVSFFVMGKVFFIQFFSSEDWKLRAENQATGLREIKAVRGNIYAADGSLLATSVPVYEIRMDLKADALTDEVFHEHLDSLSYLFSNLFKDRNKAEYAAMMQRARKAGKRFQLIKANVDYNDLQLVKDFPLIKKGRYKSGVIFIKHDIRKRPFGILAARTIGYERADVQPVGLEGAYTELLGGVSGMRLEKRLTGGVWMPLSDDNQVDPVDGKDIYTTIDVNIQDVAENALMNQIINQHADHGCVVVMEVETGHIKAVVNLSKRHNSYYEFYNYAIGEATEPGSTFKLPVLMAAIEEGKVDVTDSVDTENGTHRFYDLVMRDSNDKGYGKITVKHAFEVSSNVGVSKVVHDAFSKEPQRLIDRLNKMGLNQKLGIKIKGEGSPKIKSVSDKSWSGVSLAWMSIGYEVLQTPLQTLTFYNAVANNGIMVQPQFVKGYKEGGDFVEFPATVLNTAICSKETIKKARAMLEGVVTNGTAKNLRVTSYSVAGKTGTAQIANDKYGYRNYDSDVSYQASFVGYFPADKPKYSCIVVINGPTKDIYGATVTGPIFKEIADKIYATSLDMHKQVGISDRLVTGRPPYSKHGYQKDLATVFNKLGVKTNDLSLGNDWVVTTTGDSVVKLQPRSIDEMSKHVPNVVGMGLMDALYLLENQGLIVNTRGRGIVSKQSILPGTRIINGSRISIELAS
jgi:cell division protein FtsI (penicillin-binding protein 3)